MGGRQPVLILVWLIRESDVAIPLPQDHPGAIRGLLTDQVSQRKERRTELAIANVGISLGAAPSLDLFSPLSMVITLTSLNGYNIGASVVGAPVTLALWMSRGQ